MSVGSGCQKSNLLSCELQQLNYDLILLQETHVHCKTHAQHFERNWPGQCLWSFGMGKSAGVALLTLLFFPGEISKFTFDLDGRVLSALVSLSSTAFNIVNIYAPNLYSECKIFFECLHDFFLSGDLIIAGDLNCVDNCLDHFNSHSDFSADKKCLQNLKSDFCLIDVWHKQNPCVVSFTWSNNDLSQASRINRSLISTSLLSHVHSNEILPCLLSDHNFVDLQLCFDGRPSRRNSIWKVNSPLLSDPPFKNMTSGVINKQKSCIHNFESLGALWDNLKVKIRLSCIDFCRRKHHLVN